MAADFWTSERIDVLTVNWRDGKSAGHIKCLLGTSRNAIIGKIHRLGLVRETGIAAKAKKAPDVPPEALAFPNIKAPEPVHPAPDEAARAKQAKFIAAAESGA